MHPDYRLNDAIHSGCTADFNDAVDAGADVSFPDWKGQEPLEVAMRCARADMAQQLIELGADPNGAVGKRQDRLIHAAARRKDFGFVRLLLSAGVPPNSRGTCDRTALHFAANAGLQYMVSDLLAHNANPNSSDTSGDTPLHLAARAGQPGTVRQLLGASADARRPNNMLYTPIHEAAAKGHTEIAVALLKHRESDRCVRSIRRSLLPGSERGRAA
ncbi:Ankyrin repeats (3 copies) [Novipirellula galeiformis]|uniref:Ankyrin repeats (3 copies) n=1 Tax=Novipirellula galeiformis TaxID=2528004 RepID=A0A5C6CFF4_9BACT|nr:Ankyrin repeats (3 copies) [Novipirellula galeiformis]